MPTGFASTGANPHTQSFEEIYGIPENFLEIEVRGSGTASRWST
jgi:sorting nexin-3/12